MNENKSNVSRETIESNVSGILENVSERVHVDGDSISERTTKKGNLAVQKKYNFAVKIGTRVGMTVSDSQLIESIEKIFVAERAKTVMGYVICKEMARIADSGKLEGMGFKNIAEFGRAMFNYKTSTSNHYARIGRNFIDDNYHVKEGLPELSISHFIELNAHVGEDGDISDIVDMYLDGTLVDGMSTKDVRNALNSKKDIIEAEFTNSDDSDEGESAPIDENKSTDSSKGKKEKASQLADSDSDSDSFDANVECGKALNAITAFNECMMKLNANGIQVQGYQDMLNQLADMVKALIQ